MAACGPQDRPGLCPRDGSSSIGFAPGLEVWAEWTAVHACSSDSRRHALTGFPVPVNADREEDPPPFPLPGLGLEKCCSHGGSVRVSSAALGRRRRPTGGRNSSLASQRPWCLSSCRNAKALGCLAAQLSLVSSSCLGCQPGRGRCRAGTPGPRGAIETLPKPSHAGAAFHSLRPAAGNTGSGCSHPPHPYLTHW